MSKVLKRATKVQTVGAGTRVLTSQPDIRKAAARVLSTGRPARAAVAFWGGDADSSLMLDQIAGGLEIICNLASGASDPSVLRRLQQAGADVRSLDDLHAKVYLGEGEVIIGSANASANGLGLVGREVAGWKEACVITSDKSALAECAQWFGDLWNQSTVVDERALHAAGKLWKQRRTQRPWRTETTDLLQALETSVRDFEARNIYVRVDRSDLTDAGFDALDAFTAGNRGKWGAFEQEDDEDWQMLPPSSELIEFVWEEGRPLRFDGVFRTPKDPRKAAIQTGASGGSTIVPCEELDLVAGAFKIAKQGSTARLWKNAAKALAQSRSGAGGWMQLAEFAKMFLRATDGHAGKD